MKEIFKKIPEFDDYEVSNFGNVVSLKFGKRRVLKVGVDGQGYYHVKLCKNKKPFTKKVHRLVMSAFEGNSKLHVNHKDCDRLNNRLDNLEYTTQRQNVEHYFLNKKTSSQYTGVYWDKSAKKWKAQIAINGKNKHLGLFTDELEASQAYQFALSELNLKQYKTK